MRTRNTMTGAAALLFVCCMPATCFAPTLAERIVADAGVDRGLCVVVSCSDPSLLIGLHKTGRFMVHAVDPDPAKIEKCRTAIGDHYGRALSVEQSPLDRLPYADNLVNLVVVPDVGLTGFSLKETVRVLRPRGVAHLAAKSEDALERKLRNAPGAKQRGRGAIIVKPRRAGEDDWSHVGRGPDNHRVSADRFAGPPFATQWIAGPKIMNIEAVLGRKPYAIDPITANGRFFYLDTPLKTLAPNTSLRAQASLVALDAYNGLRLWERSFPARQGGIVAVGDRVYSALTGGCQVIDAATGKTVATYDLPGVKGAAWSYLAHYRGLLYGRVRNGTIFALEATTGELRWKTTLDGTPLCLGGGRLYACHHKKAVVAFDAATGTERWRKPADHPGHGYRRLRGFFADGALFLVRGNKVVALSAKDGSDLRTFQGHERGFNSYAVIHGGLFNDTRWGHFKAYDVKTGRPKTDVDLGHGSGRCTVLSGVRDWLLYCGGFGAVNVRTGEKWLSNVARTSCKTALITGNGLTYAMPNDCFCGHSVRGIVAIANAGETAMYVRPADPLTERFERGAAFGAPVEEAAAPGPVDWPRFRHDIRNSAVSPARVELPVKSLWEARVSGRPTPPAVAHGLVFVGTTDNQVHCFDARTGRPRWTHIAGGAVTVTPTVHQDLLLFGALDGTVAGLRTATGKLVWRFRAAPRRRRIIMYDRLTSTWPVGGGVCVVDDVAHFYAGRAAHDGARLFAAEPRTGKLLWRADIGVTDKGAAGLSPSGAMVSDGKRLFVPTGFAQPGAFDLAARRIAWIPKGGIAHNTFYNKRGGDRLTLNQGWLVVRQDTPRGWKRGGPYYIYQAATGKGQYSGVEGQPLERPKAKTRHFIVQHANGGSMVFVGDELYATERGDAGTTIRGITAKRTGRRDDWKAAMALRVRWSLERPIKVTAAVVAADTYFCAGEKKADGTGLLIALAKADGRKLGQWPLAAAPVQDGVAAARGRLYLSTADGRTISLGKGE